MHVSPAPEGDRNVSVTDYEYAGLMARAWDLLRGDTSGWADRFFYLEVVARSGQPVLDVGCGTGRLLLDYLAQGIVVDGVDNSPEMLALCRQKAVRLGLIPTLHEQSMESLDLPRRYRTVLIPSSSHQLIVEPAALDQALRRLHAHLLPGGTLAASFMTLWKPGDPLETESEHIAIRPEDGASFRRVSRSRYDSDTALEHTETLYQMIVADRVVAEELHRRSPATRSYTQPEARAVLERVGFTRVELYSGFTFEPARPDDTLFVAVAQRPGGA